MWLQLSLPLNLVVVEVVISFKSCFFVTFEDANLHLAIFFACFAFTCNRFATRFTVFNLIAVLPNI